MVGRKNVQSFPYDFQCFVVKALRALKMGVESCILHWKVVYFSDWIWMRFLNVGSSTVPYRWWTWRMMWRPSAWKSSSLMFASSMHIP